jgi:hypothetical protein
MTPGLRGCGPLGLAVAAQRRGFQARAILADHQTPCLSAVRIPEKKDVMRLVNAPLREEAEALEVTQEFFNVMFEDIGRAIRQSAIPIVLIDSYRGHSVKIPHWVVITGFDRRNIYFHDPYEGFYAGPAQHVRFAIPDFRRMRRYGKIVHQRVIFVGRAGQVTEGTPASTKSAQDAKHYASY